jgi:hypothetical protein
MDFSLNIHCAHRCIFVAPICSQIDKVKAAHFGLRGLLLAGVLRFSIQSQLPLKKKKKQSKPTSFLLENALRNSEDRSSASRLSSHAVPETIVTSHGWAPFTLPSTRSLPYLPRLPLLARTGCRAPPGGRGTARRQGRSQESRGAAGSWRRRAPPEESSPARILTGHAAPRRRSSRSPEH